MPSSIGFFRYLLGFCTVKDAMPFVAMRFFIHYLYPWFILNRNLLPNHFGASDIFNQPYYNYIQDCKNAFL
jgi:hypothetical protein